MKSHFLMLAEYNGWANERLGRDLAGLGHEALAARHGVNFGSILGILNHLLLCDQLWLSRFTGRPCAITDLAAMPHAGLAELAGPRRDLDRAVIGFAGRLEPAALEGDLRYRTTEGAEQAQPLAQCLAHFFNHQTHHRGQVHALAAAAGAPVRDLDLIFFLRRA